MAHATAWAGTQNNLGIALADLGMMTGGAKGRKLLADAVEAYRAALQIRTRAAQPMAWAATQNNLGVALAGRAAKVVGSAGMALLGDAVAAWRAALEVYTRAEHPVDWATTQENLGLAFEEIGDRGDDAAGRYSESVASFSAALEVFGTGGMEPNRVKCERNRARVAGKLAAGPSAES